MYFSLETTWSITALYLYSLDCEIIFELLHLQNEFVLSILLQIRCYKSTLTCNKCHAKEDLAPL